MSPPTVASVRVPRLLGVLGANRPPVVAQIAHTATCDARKVDDFGMSEELTVLRAVELPAARNGAERLATSFLTTSALGTWSQTAIPTRQRRRPHT